MSLSNAHDVYLVERGRRPSFDSFVETGQQNPVRRRIIFDDVPAPFIEDIMPSIVDIHPDELDSGQPSDSGEDASESFDRAKEIAIGAYRDLTTSRSVPSDFTKRTMSDIDRSDEDEAYAQSVSGDEPNLDNASPEPEAKMANTRSSGRAGTAAQSAGKGCQPQGRTLRQRNLNQQHPYEHDKQKHALTQKRGKDAKSSDIEAAVIESTQRPKKRSRLHPQNKKRTATRQRSETASKAGKPSPDSTLVANEGSLSSTPASTDGFNPPPLKNEYNTDEIMQRTKLYLYLKSDPNGPAITVPLDRCPTLDRLIAFVNQSWVKCLGGALDSIVCILHWKEENNKILLQEEMEYCFEEMMEEIKDAPAWKKAGKLQVKMMVALA